jgi:hypothetical protein
MNRSRHFSRKLSAVTALAVLASVLTPVVWAAPPGETVTVRAADLQAKADHHAELAAFYRERATPWSKHLITYFTMANHCDQLANRYRTAALEAGRRG